jgi:ribosomal protein L37AE/L43A
MGSKSWLLLAAGESRQYAGNDGYLDQPDAFYSWDSTVQNHAAIQEGDFIALWDKHVLLGVSVIDSIETEHTEKTIMKCPSCRKATIKRRKNLLPRFRCYGCSSEFDSPLTSSVSVKQYRARYDAEWVDLTSTLRAPEIRPLCVAPKSQLSLRPIVWDSLTSALRSRVTERIHGQVPSSNTAIAREGHREIRTRARIGQSDFREGLLERFGDNCALTGPAPPAALEAAHLYSYADIGRHHSHGGLLLRRDVHRLFDRGDLAIHPDELSIDADPSVRSYRSYSPLHGRRIHVEVEPQHKIWIERHWARHRNGGTRSRLVGSAGGL